MKCSKCGNIINDNSISCPYCGQAINEDYFGYRNSEERIRAGHQSQNRPKDNSAKIVLIVISSIIGLFSIVLFSILLMSSGGSAPVSAQPKYDGSFSITTDAEFKVTDGDNKGEYRFVLSRGDVIYSDTMLNCGEDYTLSLPEGEYDVVVHQNMTGEKITLHMTVEAECPYTNANLMFDEKQVMLSNSAIAS